MAQTSPVLLCILDGVGIAPASASNAITQAKTPTMDMLSANYPQSELRTDGEYVGVVPGQMGNSEVGHITIGAGRVIPQSLPRITKDLETGAFAKQAGFTNFYNDSKDARAIHLIGLLSDGGIHSHIEHVLGIVKILNAVGKPVFIHAITDGRDTSVDAARDQIAKFENDIKPYPNASIASVAGRFYAMDRDNRWDRTKAAWDVYTGNGSTTFATTTAAIKAAYGDDLSDEHIAPCRISNVDDNYIKDGDAVFMFNFRSDRVRQLTRVLLGMVDEPGLSNPPKLKSLATITEYESTFRNMLHTVYTPEHHANLLGEVVANAGRTQLRIAETEKFAHVTFFFNNGRDDPFKNEERILVPSPREVATYDLKPQMSLPKVTEELVAKIKVRAFDLMVLNIANGDMVGHTGNIPAGITAVEAIDTALAKICEALYAVDGEALIIADHGNIEEMEAHGETCTTHSTNPVPCRYFGSRFSGLDSGGLADIAPTILGLMGLPQPAEMTGKSLLRL